MGRKRSAQISSKTKVFGFSLIEADHTYHLYDLPFRPSMFYLLARIQKMYQEEHVKSYALNINGHTNFCQFDDEHGTVNWLEFVDNFFTENKLVANPDFDYFVVTSKRGNAIKNDMSLTLKDLRLRADNLDLELHSGFIDSYEIQLYIGGEETTMAKFSSGERGYIDWLVIAKLHSKLDWAGIVKLQSTI